MEARTSLITGGGGGGGGGSGGDHWSLHGTSSFPLRPQKATPFGQASLGSESEDPIISTLCSDVRSVSGDAQK